MLAGLCFAAISLKTQQLFCSAWESGVAVAADHQVTLLNRHWELFVIQKFVTVSYMLMLAIDAANKQQALQTGEFVDADAEWNDGDWQWDGAHG